MSEPIQATFIKPIDWKKAATHIELASTAAEYGQRDEIRRMMIMHLKIAIEALGGDK